MDSTIAVIGILVVIVALCVYIFVPEWLETRRLHRELQEREQKHVPPHPIPPPAPHKEKATKPPPKKP